MTAATHRRGHTSSNVHKKHDRPSEANKSKKEKKYVTTNAIFKATHDRVRKRTKSSPKSKRSGVGKSRLRREPPSSPPPRKYTLADESNEILNSYKSHVVNDSEQMIAHAYKDLVQKLEETTLGPNALNTRITHAIEAAQEMCTPFADQSVRVKYHDPAGNTVRDGTKMIGETVTEFKRVLRKQRDKLESLWEAWEDVRQKIAETGAQILHDSEFPTQFGLEVLDNSFNPPSRKNPEVESLRRLIKKESEKAHKELDQEAKDAVNKHKEYQTMWRAWLDDEVNYE